MSLTSVLPEHRNITTPRQTVRLLKRKGVHASVIRHPLPGGGTRPGLDVDTHDLCHALAELPADKRLPSPLEELMEAARDGGVYVDLNGERRDISKEVGGFATAFLLGYEGDRRGALKMLWDVHDQWRQARSPGKYLGCMTREEQRALLVGAGVGCELDHERRDGLTIDRPSLVRALGSLPTADQLPPQLLRLVEAARDGAVIINKYGVPTDVAGLVAAVAATYLIGRPGDRADCLDQLWALHELWRRAKGGN